MSLPITPKAIHQRMAPNLVSFSFPTPQLSMTNNGYWERVGGICLRFSNSRNEIETYLNPWTSWDSWSSCWSLISLMKRNQDLWLFINCIYKFPNTHLRKNKNLLVTRELLSQPHHFKSQLLETSITITHLRLRLQLSEVFISASEVWSLQTSC